MVVGKRNELDAKSNEWEDREAPSQFCSNFTQDQMFLTWVGLGMRVLKKSCLPSISLAHSLLMEYANDAVDSTWTRERRQLYEQAYELALYYDSTISALGARFDDHIHLYTRPFLSEPSTFRNRIILAVVQPFWVSISLDFITDIPAHTAISNHCLVNTLLSMVRRDYCTSGTVPRTILRSFVHRSTFEQVEFLHSSY